ncbi:MAG: monovalent cation/H+ antiporter subunit D family protein [Candidatus Aminicenantes bacterium]|nr:monovalent cation/H+ antiporter subunit D family protein [Candidatus Aminicenantes bacterium]
MTLLIDNSPVLIPLIFLATALLIPVVAAKRKTLAWPLAFWATIAVVAVSIFNVRRVICDGPVHYRLGNWAPPIGIEYVLDHLSAFVILVINSVALLVLLHAKKVVARELPHKRVPYYAAVILMLCGFNGIVITGDLFNLYVFLEISALSLYGLIAAGEKQSPVAAFRYLIMGTIAASFYLLGVGFLYMETGSLNMADVKAILPTVIDQPAILVALVLMVLGMGIKMALFPMHGWLPDAYTYAPTTSSAIIAPTGTKVGAYVMLRVMFFVFGVNFVSKTLPLTQIISWLSAIAIIYGSVLAIAQKEMKRMLAYSSVAQIGYIGLGIGLANPMALIGALFHVLNHAFMKACLFLVAGNFRYKLGHSNVSRLTDAVRKKMPWTMAAFTVAALSMVGLPPLSGFFSKLFLILGAYENSAWYFIVIIFISSLLNAVYFFRILEKVYMRPRIPVPGQEEETDVKRDEVSASMLLPTLILAAGLIIFGILNAFIVKGIINFMIPAGM